MCSASGHSPAGPARAHLHCLPWKGGVPGQPNLCRQRSMVELGAAERRESSKNSDNWSQLPGSLRHDYAGAPWGWG